MMTSRNQTLLLASGYSTADQPGIQAFLFDEATGELTANGSFTGITAPSFLIVHPNKQWVYAVSETGQSSHRVLGEVWALQIRRELFLLKPINRRTSRGDWPCHLQLDRTGHWLITTNYGTGSAAIYPLLPDGSLGEMTDFVQHHGKGPNVERQEGPHAHSSIFAPDNRFVIIADLGIDQLVIYEFDSTAGTLLQHSTVKSQPGAGPRHLVFHPNDRWFYAANELANTVTFYEYEDVNGMLIEKQTLPTIPFDSPENIVADIHISGDGKRLYVSNRGHNSIAVFDINRDGGLSLVSIPSCSGNWPRNFALASNGGFVLVANQYSDEICVLPIPEGKEALGAPVSRVTVTGVSCIQFI
jgi:6-phosphogluconolactonase